MKNFLTFLVCFFAVSTFGASYPAGTAFNFTPEGALIVSSGSSGSSPIAVFTPTNGYTAFSSATFTNTQGPIAYSANDLVCSEQTNVMVFAVGRVNGGSGYITRAVVCTDNPTNANTFRLWLYTSAPASMPSNNAPFALLWANQTNRIGYLDIGPLSDEGTGSTSSHGQNITDKLPFITYGTNVIYGFLETLTVYTPQTNQIYSVSITADQN